MTEIHPGDPVRSVELRESAWNTILEATQYSGIGHITNVVDAIKAQLREPIADPKAEHAGFSVHTTNGSRIDHPDALDVDVEAQILSLLSNDGYTVAIYAPGSWSWVCLTTTKEAGDVSPTD